MRTQSINQVGGLPCRHLYGLSVSGVGWVPGAPAVFAWLFAPLERLLLRFLPRPRLVWFTWYGANDSSVGSGSMTTEGLREGDVSDWIWAGVGCMAAMWEVAAANIVLYDCLSAAISCLNAEVIVAVALSISVWVCPWAKPTTLRVAFCDFSIAMAKESASAKDLGFLEDKSVIKVGSKFLVKKDRRSAWPRL